MQLRSWEFELNFQFNRLIDQFNRLIFIVFLVIFSPVMVLVDSEMRSFVVDYFTKLILILYNVAIKILIVIY